MAKGLTDGQGDCCRASADFVWWGNLTKSDAVSESVVDVAKRSLEDQMDREPGRSTDGRLSDCMERLNNDDRLLGDLYALSWHLNSKKPRKKLCKFLKHVKSGKKMNMENKQEYTKCVEAVEKVIIGVDDVMKVFNDGGQTDPRDRKASTESDEMDCEGQRLIKLLDKEGNFFKDVKKQSKELQKYDMGEIRTELEDFVNVMKAEKKRNKPALGGHCVEKYINYVSNWKKRKSTAEKIRKASSLYFAPLSNK